MNVESVLNRFTAISLAEMDQVKLMNRSDRKYWFHQDALATLLEAVRGDFFVLEIDGLRQLPYSSTYYDTLEDKMYYEHHRGKLNRFKIRRRQYENSNISFLEIKFKNNKGKTIKSRIRSDYSQASFSANDGEFIAQNSPFEIDELKPSLINHFSRITLVNKNMKERCTIDQNLNYTSNNQSLGMQNLVIVEVKTEGHSAPSPMIDMLNMMRIKTSGFSKYCVGRSIAEPALKTNNFKNLHRQIEKKLNISFNPTINTTSA